MKARSTWLPLCWSFCLLSCSSQQSVQSNEIVIEGNISHIPDGKIYLIGGYSHERLDSTACRSGHFRFVLKADSAFVPRVVSVQYKDSLEARKERRMFMFKDYKLVSFRNYTRGADSLKYSTSTFMLEKGHTKLVGDAEVFGQVRVFAGPETTVMYSLQMQDFGWLGNTTGTTRTAKLNFFKRKIKDNPFSYYLLDGIYNNKEEFSEQELREMVGLFQPAVQQSGNGRKMVQYLANRIDTNQAYPDFTLADPAGQQKRVFNPQANVTMLVFWASWCGPCRKEIPQLKALYQQYAHRGLQLVSISVDKKAADWQQALGQEQMRWSQGIVEENQLDVIKQRFNFSAIPCVVFIDKDRREIRRFTGYSEANPTHYRALLAKELASK
ncbi:AhpC/TSA family protein [Hymenobacter setariae]|uniref:AhpC/TSA family protein n=1 Tax=Hymenobacter setariae TaxID=2594794 RepID=A0A558BS31_9BACT|nr:TlpA disulfide reductase family protein [Hymenobacter setariae]TVT39303.1 AhpC/TSA family protein [Hymenobacter setariae]